MQRAPDSCPQPYAVAWGLPHLAPRCGPGVGKEKEAPASAWEEQRTRPRPARPYLGSKACPRGARQQEAPEGAGRPRRALGRLRRRLPSRMASAAPRPADLPPFAATVETALCLQTRPRRWNLGQARGEGAELPKLLRLSRLGLPQSRPGLRAGGRSSQWAGRYF